MVKLIEGKTPKGSKRIGSEGRCRGLDVFSLSGSGSAT